MMMIRSTYELGQCVPILRLLQHRQNGVDDSAVFRARRSFQPGDEIDAAHEVTGVIGTDARVHCRLRRCPYVCHPVVETQQEKWQLRSGAVVGKQLDGTLSDESDSMEAGEPEQPYRAGVDRNK